MEYIDLTILVTVATAILVMVLSFKSGAAKRANGLRPYDLIENETARIADRIHMNTVESVVVFLPLLWVGAVYADAMIASILGVIWVLSRVGYAYAYAKEPSSRALYFATSFFCCIGFMLLILYGILF